MFAHLSDFRYLWGNAGDFNITNDISRMMLNFMDNYRHIFIAFAFLLI